ncbi:MAG: mechanosensitive ion channel [bacterium]
MDSVQWQELMPQVIEIGTHWGLKVLGAIAVLIVGRIVSGVLSGGVQRALKRASMDEALVRFVGSLVRFAVLAFAVIAALDLFGIQTTSFVAVLGAAGLAVGLALQGSLSNFASGVLILVFKPFRIGDFVKAAGTAGSVVDIGILTTTLKTPDNQKIIVPNSSIMGDTITNVNAFDTRRVDLVAGIGYGDDIAKAHHVLQRILSENPKVLKDPAPMIEVSELADSSVNFVVRPWVKTPDYWAVYFEVTRKIKEEFDREGVSIPFPQRDVHLYQAASGN